MQLTIFDDICLVHPGVWDKRRVSGIDFYPAQAWDSFLVTSQWASDVTVNDLIKWPIYP